jgi:acid phosphatase (class A)
MMDSMKTPSYPSGHSTQGILIAKVLSDLYPELSSEILKKGREISFSRNIGKAHFPSDSKIGQELGTEMYEYLKDSGFLNKFDGIYQEKE